jgi:hypothetical protein
MEGLLEIGNLASSSAKAGNFLARRISIQLAMEDPVQQSYNTTYVTSISEIKR